MTEVKNSKRYNLEERTPSFAKIVEKAMIETKGHANKIPQHMLTVKEVASILNLHSSTVRRWEKEGLLKSYRIGPRHSLRFKQEDIFDFLDRSRNEVHTVVQ